eukprot:116142-Ditylum_brightwellii.AAC.1
MKRVHCFEKFVNIPILDKSSPYPAVTDYSIRFGAIEGQNNVDRFPEWRKLRRMQEIMLYDQ